MTVKADECKYFFRFVKEAILFMFYPLVFRINLLIITGFWIDGIQGTDLHLAKNRMIMSRFFPFLINPRLPKPYFVTRLPKGGGDGKASDTYDCDTGGYVWTSSFQDSDPMIPQKYQ